MKFHPNWHDSVVSPDATIRDALEAIVRSGAFMACIVADNGVLTAIMTDSDVRKALLEKASLDDKILNWSQKQPITATDSSDPAELISLAQQNSVREIPLVDSFGRLTDIFILLNHQDRVPIVREETNRFEVSRVEELPNHMLLLAGGLGTRLRSVVNDRPKPLALVGGRPIIETVILRAAAAGIRNFYVSVNYMAEQIENFLHSYQFDHLNIKIIREERRLGTAGAIGLIKKQITHPLMVTNADVLTTAPLAHILRHHAQVKAEGTCCVRPHETIVPYGVVEIMDQKIQCIKEKPRNTVMVNAGIYVLNPEICQMVEANEPLDMPELIKQSIEAGFHIAPFFLHEYWVDIGRPEDFKKANKEYQVYFGDR